MRMVIVMYRLLHRDGNFEGGTRLSSKGGSDVFVIKFDKNGIIRWGMSLEGVIRFLNLAQQGWSFVSFRYIRCRLSKR